MLESVLAPHRKGEQSESKAKAVLAEMLVSAAPSSGLRVNEMGSVPL
jgi:hypothetical protein